MPRRSHRPDRRPRSGGRADDEETSRGTAGWQRSQSTGDGEFLVRTVPGGSSAKSYRCPGCQQVISPGVPHLVVWPAWTGEDDGVASRRHWHSGCWTRRAERGGPNRLVW